MANATATGCTLVNTALVVGAVTAGFLVAGMTITAPGVPAGVTIVSQSTGPTGGAGTYVATASSANVTSAETFTFSLSGLMPYVGNGARRPDDALLAAGFAAITMAAAGSPTSAPGAQYTFGTHQAAIYNQQAQSSTAIYKAAIAKETTYESARYIAVAQQIYQTPPPVYAAPVVAKSFGVLGAEYQFGTHTEAIYNQQARSGTNVWPSVRTPPLPSQGVPIKYIFAEGQDLRNDLNLKAVYCNIPLLEGWISTWIGASPQGQEYIIQPQFTPASQFTHPQAPINPTYFFARPQDDPRQVSPPAQYSKPVLAQPQIPKPIAQPFVNAAPPLADQVNAIQPQISKAVVAGPAKYVQPKFFFVPQQAYVDVYPTQITKPVIGIFIPPIVPVPPYVCTPIWDFSGKWQWDFSGYPGWDFSGYEPTPLQCAVQGLASVGVNVGTLTYQYSQTVPIGWVITGWPPFMNSNYFGQYIPLTISQGPPPIPTTITVPNVVGMFYYDAQLAILDAGFDTAYPTWALSTTVLPQYVISQSIPPGTQFQQATQITIVVSGFPVVNQPNTVVPVP